MLVSMSFIMNYAYNFFVFKILNTFVFYRKACVIIFKLPKNGSEKSNNCTNKNDQVKKHDAGFKFLYFLKFNFPI